jgi:hypothetical protein
MKILNPFFFFFFSFFLLVHALFFLSFFLSFTHTHSHSFSLSISHTHTHVFVAKPHQQTLKPLIPSSSVNKKINFFLQNIPIIKSPQGKTVACQKCALEVPYDVFETLMDEVVGPRLAEFSEAFQEGKPCAHLCKQIFEDAIKGRMHTGNEVLVTSYSTFSAVCDHEGDIAQAIKYSRLQLASLEKAFPGATIEKMKLCSRIGAFLQKHAQSMKDNAAFAALRDGFEKQAAEYLEKGQAYYRVCLGPFTLPDPSKA